MKNNLLSKASSVVRVSMFKLKKHSPELLILTGVAGVVASGITACIATRKLDSVLEPAKEKINELHECEEVNENGEVSEETKRELALTYVNTGVSLVKLYGPSVVLGSLSIGCILASNNILRKRNVALGAAYAAIDKGFKTYRSRVIERFGDQVDNELRFGLKSSKVGVMEKDETTGEEKLVKKTGSVVNPAGVSDYARLFEKYMTDENGNSVINPYWETNLEYNLMFLKAQERYANDLLKVKKILFLNDVYEMLGIPKTKAGQIVGWIYNPEHPNGDNFVSFGIYADNLSYRDYGEGYDPAILLDFNVDGNVWDLM